MNSKIKPGPAFPTSIHNSAGNPIVGFKGEEVPMNTTHVYSGVSLRDWLAATVGIDSGWPVVTAEKLVGREFPADSVLAKAEFWAEFRSRLRHIEADAMLRISALDDPARDALPPEEIEE